MNKFREKFLKQLESFKLGGVIPKFQSPAGPIEAQLRYAANTGRPIETYKLNDKSLDELYNLSHEGGSGLAYQLINGGLYLAAPATFGVSLLPAAAMSAGAIGSTAHNMSKEGVGLGNGLNMGFDVLNALPGAGLALRSLQTAGKIGKAARAAEMAGDAVTNATKGYLSAEAAAEAAAKATVKARAKRDALSQVLFEQGKTATYNPAWRAANKAAEDAAKKGKYVGKLFFEVVDDPKAYSYTMKMARPPRVGDLARVGYQEIVGTTAEEAVKQAAKVDAAKQASKQAILTYNNVVRNADDARKALYMYAPWTSGSNAYRALYNATQY